MFNEIILDHFQNPRNAGELPDANASAEASNPVCGDILRLSARVDSGYITQIQFKAQGCVAAIAAASVLTELLMGKSREQARDVTALAISTCLGGLPPSTFHAAQLCVDATSALIRHFPVAP